jgi:hypothetical protein
MQGNFLPRPAYRKIDAGTNAGCSFMIAMLNLLPTEVERWQSPVDRT